MVHNKTQIKKFRHIYFAQLRHHQENTDSTVYDSFLFVVYCISRENFINYLFKLYDSRVSSR